MRALAAIALFLAACAPVRQAPPTPLPIPQTSAIVAADALTIDQALEADSGPSMTIVFDLEGPEARDRVRSVAVRCWLDHVVRGSTMFADEASGSLVIVSDNADLVSVNFLPHQGSGSRVKLAGQALADEMTKSQLILTLDTAVRTGETACPPTAG
ncbi:MAG: hypothetical protein AAGC81_08090 [Pseudomonadota bacterium]